jgi:hypothetical protein
MNKIFKNPIIKELLDRHIPIIVTSEGFTIEGFYKSNCILLQLSDNDTFIAIDRYGESTDIDNFDDLVRLNYKWWHESKDRFEGWQYPDKKWLEDMERLRLIEKVIITEYRALR